MGKKDKKKGKGAEKTAAKTDKKLTQKMKKELTLRGEVSSVLLNCIRVCIVGILYNVCVIHYV